jgi:hypothetical protein
MEPVYRKHILQRPLIAYSGSPLGQIGILPSGTSLRYIESFPEGFDRFQIYLNVERFPLPLEEEKRPNFVDPLSAFPNQNITAEDRVISTDELRRLLHSLHVTKSDLEMLIESYE